MNSKQCLYLFLISISLLFTSCLGSSSTELLEYSKDAQLNTFQLSHDSLPALSALSYNIDQLQSSIYNPDSLNFGSVVPEKAVLNFTTVGFSVALLHHNEAGEWVDSTFLTTGDSITITPFINNKTPYIRVYAYDGTKKDYSLDLRVHTVDPDSMVYKKLPLSLPNYDQQKTVYLSSAFYSLSIKNGVVSLYTSTDAQNWTNLSFSGLPNNLIPSSLSVFQDKLVVLSTDGKLYYSSADFTQFTQLNLPNVTQNIIAVLGEVKAVEQLNPANLALLVKESGQEYFASTNLLSYTLGEEAPNTFPVAEFASASWIKAYQSHLVVAGGSLRSGMPASYMWRNRGDALSWDEFTPEGYKGAAFSMPYLQANLFFYNQQLHLMNGQFDNASYNPSISTSITGALTWQAMPAKYNPRGGYTLRKNASICIDEQNYIYILGGTYGSTVLHEVWKVRLNRLGF